MDKRRDTINDINIETVLANYLQDDCVRSADVERLMLDDSYGDIADKVMREHWDSISSQMSDKETIERWTQLKRRMEVGMQKAQLMARQKKIFHWAVAATALLAILTNIYQLNKMGVEKMIDSSDVVVDVLGLEIDSLPREPLRKKVDQQKIVQTSPSSKVAVVESIEVLESIIEKEVEEEKSVKQPPHQKEYLSEHVTRAGETLKLRLADGTTVRLHENTRIIADINDSLRTISLQGKAHFAVASNRDLSFQISTRNVLIEVLGTEFEVDSHENAEHSAIRVDKGAVRVTTSDNVKFTLRPNQTLVFDNKSHSVSILRGVANDSTPKKKK